ncbi:MAG: hypothetical protein JXK94_02160 [Deltaproteobacteria bacterium]|nr:hypothetical protein [Deltaproteobacteria bacterium]
MAKKNQKISDSQMSLDFSAQIDSYIEERIELTKSISQTKPRIEPESEFELCIEVASVIKQSIRASGLSRAQVVDAINLFFGRTEAGAEADPPTCRRPLTIHQLNKYLSSPIEHAIPLYFAFALQDVTKSMEPAATIIAAAGGQVATAEEIRLLNLGKIEKGMDELRRLRNELKGGRQ